jgi:hypothetical protein
MDEELDGTHVVGMTVHEEGVELTARYASDERMFLDRGHTFYVAFAHEEFGTAAQELVIQLRDFAWELAHNYLRQPAADETAEE